MHSTIECFKDKTYKEIPHIVPLKKIYTEQGHHERKKLTKVRCDQ